jgi:hypothetical protein
MKTLYLICLVCVCLWGCVTVKKGVMGPDGTNMLVTLAEITGFGKNCKVESNHGVTLMAPVVSFTRPDGTIITATNATVTMFDYESIGGDSTIPAGINAGANLVGAGAELAGAGRP